MNQFAKLALLGLSLALGACTVLQTSKIDYKSAGKATGLEVPPDLTQLAPNNQYSVPGATVTASSYDSAQAAKPAEPETAISTLGDMHIEHDGNDYWLVVNRPADQLWGPVRDFWQENGFLLTQDDRKLGVIQTDWAENRAKLPQDIIRRTVGKLFDQAYDTGTRDKFRTRLERNRKGGTDIFITHQGMKEVYTDQMKTQTMWEPTPPDHGLEAIFLSRLMLKLGASQEQAKTIMATAAVAKPTARVATLNGQPVVQMDEGFERAWRRVGLTLDRTGFTVEDRDRSKGLYFVRYVDPTTDYKEPGFFSKLFSGSSAPKAPLQYRIAVQSQGDATTVSVQNSSGDPATSANAQRIVKVIADDLN
ncbi:MAG: outer membrane protein assembly factor BamC [Rhodoferax sp.]